MATKTLTHAASLGAPIAFMALTPILPAPAADGPQKSAVKVVASEGTSRSIPLGIGKSVAGLYDRCCRWSDEHFLF